MVARNSRTFNLNVIVGCHILWSVSSSLLLLTVGSVGTASLNVTIEWVAPENISKNFPYFLTGHDAEGCPVWIVPFGSWDVQKAVTAGGQTLKDFHQYVVQLFYRLHNTEVYGRNGAENFVVVTDADGYSLSQFMSVATISELSKLATEFVEVDRKGRKVKVGYFVNVTFMFETLLNLAKPLVGDLFNFAEVYGTNPDSWKPVLLRNIPRSQLPASLGGKYCHEFIKSFG